MTMRNRNNAGEFSAIWNDDEPLLKQLREIEWKERPRKYTPFRRYTNQAKQVDMSLPLHCQYVGALDYKRLLMLCPHLASSVAWNTDMSKYERYLSDTDIYRLYESKDVSDDDI